MADAVPVAAAVAVLEIANLPSYFAKVMPTTVVAAAVVATVVAAVVVATVVSVATVVVAVDALTYA